MCLSLLKHLLKNNLLTRIVWYIEKISDANVVLQAIMLILSYDAFDKLSCRTPRLNSELSCFLTLRSVSQILEKN